jgi:hypothetical protein
MMRLIMRTLLNPLNHLAVMSHSAFLEKLASAGKKLAALSM